MGRELEQKFVDYQGQRVSRISEAVDFVNQGADLARRGEQLSGETASRWQRRETAQPKEAREPEVEKPPRSVATPQQGEASAGGLVRKEPVPQKEGRSEAAHVLHQTQQ